MKEPDDTTLDALAAQVRAYPPLELEEVARLLRAAHVEPGGPEAARLVEHHLSVALAAALTRRGGELDVADLYQEGTVAVTVAVAEYASREGEPGGLKHYVERLVGVHLDSALGEAKAAREQDEAFVRDVSEFESAELELKSELGRQASLAELAAHLEWSTHRAAVARTMLSAAREQWDEEIVEYLDDEDPEELA